MQPSDFSYWEMPSYRMPQTNMMPMQIPMGQYGGMSYEMQDLSPTLGNYTGMETFSRAAPTAVGGAASGGGSIWDSFFNKRDQQGWGGLAIGGAMGLANTILGFQQYGLAKDQLRTSKDQFNRNFNAQKNLTNARLEDRQSARIAGAGSGGSAYESPSEYMNRYGIK